MLNRMVFLLALLPVFFGASHGSGEESAFHVTRVSQNVVVVDRGDEMIPKPVYGIATQQALIVERNGVSLEIIARIVPMLEDAFGRHDFSYVIFTDLPRELPGSS